MQKKKLLLSWVTLLLLLIKLAKALDLLSTLTVQSCLTRAMDCLLQEQRPGQDAVVSTTCMQAPQQGGQSSSLCEIWNLLVSSAYELPQFSEQGTSESELSSGSSYVSSESSESGSECSTEDSD